MVPRVARSSRVCHPILKRSAETASIKTTFPRFFCAHSFRYNPAFTKPSRPIPSNYRFSSRSPNSRKPPAFKTHKSRKILKILEKSRGSLTSGNSSCLKCNPKRYIHKFRILAFHISEKSNSDCSDGGNCVRFIILETLKREIPVMREICE